MKDIVIIGAGGFAREVAWLIEEINEVNKRWNLLGFIDDNKENLKKDLNGYRVLGDIDFYKNKLSEDIFYVIAIGNGSIRKKIVEKLKNKKAAILIHPNVKISKTNSIDEGTVICSGNILTVNIKIGKHVILNLDSTIGHDTVIENFSTILPSSNISGNVYLEENVMLGTGSQIIQGIKIEKNSVIGAGAVIIKNIETGSTVVGNPGRIIKK